VKIVELVCESEIYVKMEQSLMQALVVDLHCRLDYLVAQQTQSVNFQLADVDRKERDAGPAWWP
jgi:hypothetical protein